MWEGITHVLFALAAMLTETLLVGREILCTARVVCTGRRHGAEMLRAITGNVAVQVELIGQV